MTHRTELDGIITLLQRQQAALASQATDAVDRLERVNQELQRALSRLQPAGKRNMAAPAGSTDRQRLARIAQLLIDNRALMMRHADSNRRALQVLFQTEPLVYTR
ncbi:MAG: hypothetical protein Q4E06_07265 [Lautropia sp.]|nr:hypothetical protein [Lautropia sp.]